MRAILLTTSLLVTMGGDGVCPDTDAGAAA
jgi:hypothetical protein